MHNTAVPSGAALEAKDAKGLTPLHLAAMWDQPPAIHQLAAAGADLNSQDLQQDSPLHLAASLQQLRALDALVTAGAGLNSKNRDEQTPLHIAAAKGRVQSIRALVAAGAAQSVIDDSGLKRTPFAVAVWKGQAAAALELLLAGAQPGAHQDLPLHQSTRSGLVQYFTRQLEAAVAERGELKSIRRNLALLLLKYGAADAIRRPVLMPQGAHHEATTSDRSSSSSSGSGVKAARKAAEKRQEFLQEADSCTVRAFCRGLSRMAEEIQLVRGEVASLEGVGRGMQQAIVLVAQAYREATATA